MRPPAAIQLSQPGPQASGAPLAIKNSIGGILLSDSRSRSASVAADAADAAPSTSRAADSPATSIRGSRIPCPAIDCSGNFLPRDCGSSQPGVGDFSCNATDGPWLTGGSIRPQLDQRL